MTPSRPEPVTAVAEAEARDEAFRTLETFFGAVVDEQFDVALDHVQLTYKSARGVEATLKSMRHLVRSVADYKGTDFEFVEFTATDEIDVSDIAHIHDPSLVLVDVPFRLTYRADGELQETVGVARVIREVAPFRPSFANNATWGVNITSMFRRKKRTE